MERHSSSKLILIIILISFLSVCEQPVKGHDLPQPDFPFHKHDTSCPGRYCGRRNNTEPCGACPKGYIPDEQSMCRRCEGEPSFYDWLYLGFMAMVSLVMHWGFIDLLSSPKRGVMLLHLSAFIETVLAGWLTLFLSDPVGSIHVRSCRVTQFSDWYTLLFNPSPDYYNAIYCTQEIVYPLYTMVLIYYTLSLVFMMLIRPLVAYKLSGCQSSRSVYAALYFFPILILIHSICGGILYYAFPYIVVVVSVITSACHLATEENQNMKELVKHSFTNARHLIILLGHWLLHAYGIIAITELSVPSFHAPLLALVPFPTFFYILTVRFTNPQLVFPFKASFLHMQPPKRRT